MLLALALLSGMSVQPVADGAQEVESSEITVIARKLKDWRGNWKVRDGKVTCKTTRSTGDKEIDAIGCASVVACLSPKAAEIEMMTGSKDDRGTKKARISALLKDATPCFLDSRQAGISALADRRAGQ